MAALKFRRRLALAELAARRLAIAVAELAPAEGTVIVPVPAAPLRLRRRGFDAAALIARALGAELGLPLADCLRRRHGRRQVGRTRAARREDPPLVRAWRAVPERALIVDDVLTTGATLGACAAALRANGCVHIRAAVFARALGARDDAA